MSRRVLWIVLAGGFVALAAVVVILLLQERDGPAIDVAQCAASEADSEEHDRVARDDTDEHVPDDSDAPNDPGKTDSPEEAQRDDAIGEDHEPGSIEEDEESAPYTSSNPPRLEDIKDLPIGDPREPKPPEYASNLEDDDWQVYDTTPDLDDRRNTWSHFWKVNAEDPTRRVSGRVYEIIGNERIPLRDVLVVGWTDSFTFTDENGRFLLTVNWREPPDEAKNNGESYRIELMAHAPGYVDIRARRAYSNLDETDDGFELYLVRRDSRRIRIGFENPQVAGGSVTIVLAKRDNGAVRNPATVKNWDERFYIVARVDPSEEASFTVPAHYYFQLGAAMFGLKSVSAPNILADVNTIGLVSKTTEEHVYKVRLVVEDTVTVSGTVTDMRTGEPLPNARVYGPGRTEFTVANEQGRFELITARVPKGPDGKPVPEGERFIHVAHEGYASIRTLIKNATLSNTLTGGISPEGGNLAGPWEFRLRPFVSAMIDCTGLHEAFLEDGGVGLPSKVRAVTRFYGGGWKIGPDGTCEAEFFPWGLEQMEAHTRVPQPGLPRGPVKIPPGSWQGDEPYRLKLEH